MLQGSESTVFLTAGGVRALQKLGRYTDIRARQLSCSKITFGSNGSSGRLETGFRRGLYDTCSQACSSLLVWNTRMGFSSLLRRVFFCPKICSSLHGPIRGTESGMK